ncbi:MAG TPA: OsmC family protein [Candidatus Saccharimonadales bacterium]|nr:OsmC family protein [Candidatus Saccharimonadales bacterium]
MPDLINGVDVAKIKQTKEQAQKDPSVTEREPKIVARWLGGSKARIELGDVASEIGGDGNLNAMQTLLASLAACDIDLVATHAALIDLTIEELWIEASGRFNSQAYYGIEGASGAGYNSIAYTIHLKAPKATPEQIKYLKERCERSSPVGDSLSKSIPLTLEVKAE